MKNISRIISIISYLFIILAGEMIGIPFILWLVFTIFDFGNIDQIFAILGIIGVILNFSKWKNKILITIVSFILMLSPLLSRLLQVGIEKFDYLAFQIPLTIFIISYLLFIIINIKERKSPSDSINS
ncbi:MAG: hypothetical protein ACKO8L_11770 [Flavobacterium sp.]